MPEPLSIAAGMAGALTAAAKISSTLKAVKKNAKDAPRQVAVLLEEARGTAEVLSSLQSLLLGKERLDPSRTKLLRVESVIAIVTGCVSTFSQLQEVVDYLRHDDPGVIDRARWVAREATIGAIIVRLQTHKSSLFLIVVGVINGQTTQEVERSLARLNAATKHQYQQILDRLRASASQQPSAAPTTSPYQGHPSSSLWKLSVADVGPAISAFKLAITKGEVYMPAQYQHSDARDGQEEAVGGEARRADEDLAEASSSQGQAPKKGQYYRNLKSMIGM